MFKRFLPTLATSTSSLNHRETLFDIETSSENSSSKQSNCSSEQINTSDIPTLRRRHSFVTPYAESVLEEKINRTNENADLSIDPFDTSNNLKRSKSLSFSISRRPSFSTLRKKAPKTVHFEQQEGFIEKPNYNSSLTDIPTSYRASEKFERRNKCTDSPSSFCSSLKEKKGFENTLEDKNLEINESQENPIKRRYSLFSQECVISELEYGEPQVNQKEGNNNLLPLETAGRNDIVDNKDELEGSENDNSCLFTEYSQENKYNDIFIEDSLKHHEANENSVQTDEVVYKNDHQMMKEILQNFMQIGNYELENIKDENDNMTLQYILDGSEKAKEKIKLKDTEIVQLKSQLKTNDNEKLEQVNFLQEECVRLQNELNSCKIASEQSSAKYSLLIDQISALEVNEENLRSDIMQLESDLLSSVSRLQIEIGYKEELLGLIKKYDSSEELSDSTDVLKGYIEQLLLKNESTVKENAFLLDQQLRMKDEIVSLKESLNLMIGHEQEALKSVTDENERLKACFEELKLKLDNSDLIAKKNMDEHVKLLNEKELQIFGLKSQVAFLKEEKEYSQTKHAEYLTNLEEANKQIQEELLFRNQMEKDYEELGMKMKEMESLLNNKVRIANDQLILKLSEFSELCNINSRVNQEIITMLSDFKSMKEEKEKLTTENQKLVQDAAEYKLALNLLQEHIKKSNKNVDIMSKEYLMVLKSNEIISSAMKSFAMTSFESLEPVMYEESREYFRNIYNEFVKQTLFSQEEKYTIESVSQFIIGCISDIVCQYLENETSLQLEVENRNNNYQKMLDKLTKIMEDNILKAHKSKENNNDNDTTRKLQSKFRMDTKSFSRGIIYKNPNH